MRKNCVLPSYGFNIKRKKYLKKERSIRSTIPRKFINRV